MRVAFFRLSEESQEALLRTHGAYLATGAINERSLATGHTPNGDADRPSISSTILELLTHISLYPI